MNQMITGVINGQDFAVEHLGVTTVLRHKPSPAIAKKAAEMVRRELERSWCFGITVGEFVHRPGGVDDDGHEFREAWQMVGTGYCIPEVRDRAERQEDLHYRIVGGLSRLHAKPN